MPGFGVVIVTYRSAELASRCAAAAARDEPDEIVIVDSASGDGSAELLRARHPDATVIAREINAGFAAAVNAGFRSTKAPVVVVLNADAEPRTGALRDLAGHLERSPRAGVAAPRLLHEDHSSQPSAYRRPPGLATLLLDLCLPLGTLVMRCPRLDPYRVPPHLWRTGEQVAHVTGAALAIRRVAYDQAGPFDEGFFLYLEETEWQERVRAAGWTVELVPHAVVVHLVRGGGDAALAPSPHFLASMRRYLVMRGRPAWATDAVIAVSLVVSRLAARAERFVVPAARRTGGRRAAAYDALWRRRS